MSVVTRSILTLALAVGVGTAQAQTFRPAPLVPDVEIDVLDRTVARDRLERELFGQPHASVVIGRVDVYDRFPYLEARTFQVVSDPAWNRLLFGENGRGLEAYDGEGSALGRLDEPRGLAADERGRLYVADTGNDRVVVFDTHGEFDRLELVPLFTVEGFARPQDVAFSDGGTPFDPRDDRLYVADTGHNRIARVALEEGRGRVTSTLGGLGSGEGRFAGPTAVGVGREAGRNDDLVYVADSHARRIVALRDDRGTLLWEGERRHDLPEIRGLDTDHWGNVYVASARGGEIRKFAPDLSEVARLREGLHAPRAFHVPVFTVHDHVRGTVRRAGQGSGVVVERWGERSGLRLLDLGVELDDLEVEADTIAFTLTDRAHLHARVLDAATGHVLREVPVGERAAGRGRLALDEIGRGLPGGEHRVELRAVSTYDDARVATASTTVRLGGAAPSPREPAVLGASPNPFNPRTRIEFVVPEGPALPASLRIVDTRGRIVRSVDTGLFPAGRHGYEWDGTDDEGRPVSSGVYLYRLELDGVEHAGKLALVK